MDNSIDRLIKKAITETEINTEYFEIEYRAGGYPTPTYTGTKTIGVNVFADADEDYAEDVARMRAKREIAREVVMSPGMIKIVSVKRVKA